MKSWNPERPSGCKSVKTCVRPQNLARKLSERSERSEQSELKAHDLCLSSQGEEASMSSDTEIISEAEVEANACKSRKQTLR